jgi:uncharacterized membrane protein YoaK (UPF0700 family)
VSKRVFSVSGAVRLGGVVLSVCAGIVNSVAFYALGSFVSHQTGSWSKVALKETETIDNVNALLLVASFVVGAWICGFLVSTNNVHLGVSLYDICLVIEAGLLVATTFMAQEGIAARYVAAAACGLQNGLATHWGGAVVRTTHVTGLFTDVGLLLGRLSSMLMRKRCGRDFSRAEQDAVADDLSKLSVLGSIAGGFLVGIALGVALFDAMQHYAFLVPAGVLGSFGLAYMFYRVVVRRQKFISQLAMRRSVEWDSDDEIDLEAVAAETRRQGGEHEAQDEAQDEKVENEGEIQHVAL